MPIEEVLTNLGSLPDEKRTAVRNNGGGHYNHTLFWESMGPGGGGEPDGDLGAAIGEAFGSFADFQSKLKDAGVNQFGSGWAWLVLDRLARCGLHRQPGQPDLGRQEQRCSASTSGTPTTSRTRTAGPDYIDAWWNTVDWTKVASASRRHSADRRQVDGRDAWKTVLVALKAHQAWKRIPPAQRKAILRAAQSSAKKHSPRWRGRCATVAPSSRSSSRSDPRVTQEAGSDG